MLVAVGAVIASQKPIEAAGRDIDLMQAPGLGAKRSPAITAEVLEMQHDPPRVVKIACKVVFGSRRLTAQSRDSVLNFAGKIANMVRFQRSSLPMPPRANAGDDVLISAATTNARDPRIVLNAYSAGTATG
jgi:hypothetical protein